VQTPSQSSVSAAQVSAVAEVLGFASSEQPENRLNATTASKMVVLDKFNDTQVLDLAKSERKNVD